MLWKFALSSIAFLMMPVWVMASSMMGVHDPLWTKALFIDNREKQIVLCSVDYLGFNYEMVQRVIEEVHLEEGLSNCEIYIASSHAHSGLDIPELGEYLAEPSDPNVVELYVKQTAKAIIQACKKPTLTKRGMGHGKVEDVSPYRGTWPVGAMPLSDVTVIKVTKLDDCISEKNEQAIYFNEAQRDIIPRISKEEQCSVISKTLSQIVQNIFISVREIETIVDEKQECIHCDVLGKSLAETMQKILHSIDTKESVHI